MICVLAKCVIKPEKIEEFKKIALVLVEETRKEKGCVSYDLVKAADSGNEFAFFERWESNDILAVHSKSAHFLHAIPLIGALAEGEMQVSVFEAQN